VNEPTSFVMSLFKGHTNCLLKLVKYGILISCSRVCLSDMNQTVRIVLYVLIFLLSFIGNSLIITVLVRNRRMRTVTNLFLLSLAVSDLMLCVFCMPFTLIPNLMKDFIFGSGMCKVATYFMGESF